jgi:putative phosphoribosyl transferase
MQRSRGVRVPVDGQWLEGTLTPPDGTSGLVVFAHGSGSSRHSPRNQHVARGLEAGGLGTLLIDLLTAQEEQVDVKTRHLRFDIGLLADRVVAAVDWLANDPSSRDLELGLFGASTGAAAALVAAARRPDRVRAVVSRGGRPDLAGPALRRTTTPTLLIVGGADYEVLSLNRQALAQIGSVGKLVVVPDATHLFEEPGTLDQVIAHARDWFEAHLVPVASAPGRGSGY